MEALFDGRLGGYIAWMASTMDHGWNCGEAFGRTRPL